MSSVRSGVTDVARRLENERIVWVDREREAAPELQERHDMEEVLHEVAAAHVTRRRELVTVHVTASPAPRVGRTRESALDVMREDHTDP